MAILNALKELENPFGDYVVYQIVDADAGVIKFVSDVMLDEKGFHLKFSDDFRDAIPLEKLDDAKTFRSMCTFILHYEHEFRVMNIQYRIRFRQECDLDF